MGRAVNCSVFAICAPNTVREIPPIRSNLNCINPYFCVCDILCSSTGVSVSETAALSTRKCRAGERND